MSILHDIWIRLGEPSLISQGLMLITTVLIPVAITIYKSIKWIKEEINFFVTHDEMNDAIDKAIYAKFADIEARITVLTASVKRIEYVLDNNTSVTWRSDKHPLDFFDTWKDDDDIS